MTQQAVEIKKPGYKKTKLGWIPEDWEISSLGDLMEFKNGVNADKVNYGQGYKFVNVMQIIGRNKITDDNIPGKVNLSEKLFLQNRLIAGDILFNRTSETYNDIGWAALFQGSENVVFGGFVIRGRFKNEKIKEGFKKFCFHSSSIRRQIIARGQGAVRTNIGQKDLEKVLIVIPTDIEQEKITTILSCCDITIQKLTKLIKEKQLLKKGLMQQLLTGKKRLPGFRGTWKEYKLEKFFRERNQKGCENLPLLSLGEAGVYPQSQSNKKDNSNKDKSKYKRISPGDIGYNTMRLWQGRNALSHLEGIISPAYTVVTPKENAHAEFFKYLFKLPEVVHKFHRNSQGLVSDTLNCKFKDFKIVKVVLPPTIEEQRAIANILLSADREIDLLKKKKQMLQNHKKGLMQQLLTGKKRIEAN